ncbi:MAG: CAAX prenyl protease-related protein [Pelomonas sp.]|nr:CAAX prenyl protease-related protein [Roseateles sp.]
MPFSRSAFARCLPFAIFMALLGLRGALPPSLSASLGLDARWIYGLGVVLVGGTLIWHRQEYGELARQNLPPWREALLAAGVGLAVFALWITLTAPWMQLGTPTASFVPVRADGRLDPALVAVRWVGAAVVVPLMEELFWRGFLMRWVDSPRFETVDPQRATWRAVLVSTFIFVLAHTLWLAAAIAGLAYAWLYRRHGRLWSAVIAHAVTNGVLGAWVVGTGRWEFW